jgi:putative SOS response-associated peptidase YedK
MNVRDSRVHKYPPRWNAAPSQELLVIRRSHRTGEVSLDPLRWGLIPHWCSDPTGGRKPINAKCETVCELPSFRDAYRQRRCIVPVDGFFEWKAIKGQKAKQPFAIAMKDGSLFGIAGLWEELEELASGEWIRKFAVITTDANVADIHDRMPVILAPSDYARWLSEEPDPGHLTRARAWRAPPPPRSIAPSHAADHPADAKRCERSGVGALFDGVANKILGIGGAAAHHLGGVRRRILGLPIELLRRPCRLIDESFGLGLRVAGDAAKTLLHLAADIAGGAGYAIFIHWRVLSGMNVPVQLANAEFSSGRASPVVGVQRNSRRRAPPIASECKNGARGRERKRSLGVCFVGAFFDQRAA